VAFGLQTVRAMRIGPIRIAHVLLLAACSGHGLAPSGDDGGVPPADLATPPDLSAPADVPNMTTPRSLLGVVELADGRIAAFDGLAQGALPKTTEIYSPATNQWTPSGTTVSGRYGFAATRGADGRIYAIGGTTNGMLVLGNAEAFDPVAGSWSPLPDLAAARVGATAAVAPDGRIFAVSGRDENQMLLKSVEIFDPAKNTWSAGPVIPTPRFAAAATTGSDGRIYVAGGRDPQNTPLDVVEALDTATGTWTTEAALPSPRFWFALVQLDARLYAIGGLDDTGFLDGVDSYDIASKSWSSRAPLLEARGWLGAAPGADGRIYVIGGSPPGSASFPPPSAKVMAYDPTQDRWQW
jgi:N-acetylneuraminic acid mutarotase